MIQLDAERMKRSAFLSQPVTVHVIQMEPATQSVMTMFCSRSVNPLLGFNLMVPMRESVSKKLLIAKQTILPAVAQMKTANQSTQMIQINLVIV